MTLIKRNGKWTAVESINGKRVWHSTKTENKKLAEKRAKTFFDALRADNLAAAELLMNRNPSGKTIGELLEVFPKMAIAKAPTAKGYVSAMKILLRETGTPLTTPVNSLTGKMISTFERLRHKKAKDVPELHRAKRTVSSTVRQAKAIFSKRMMQRYGDEGWHFNVDDFISRTVESGPSVRYKAPDAGLPARTLAASKELRQIDPEAYKAFLMAYFAGLRKAEIAHATVNWIEDHAIHVQPDGQFDTKNSHERTVPLAPDVFSDLQELMPAEGYLLQGSNTERTELVFRRLNKWLRGIGWTHSTKAVHELRKVYGSTVSRLAGIHAAQHLLGHMDYSTTDRYYADPSADVVVNQ